MKGRHLRELLRLAWPAVLSYILNNLYRVNDQFWIQGLGGASQSAIGATFFVQVMGFAAIFFAVGGTLALVARATGAGDPTARDSVIRHALFLGLLIGGVLTVAVRANLGVIVQLLGLEGELAPLARDYLGMLYLFMGPMALIPVIDAIFIGRGNTRIPMLLQCLAVALNYGLNPILIYGQRAREVIDAPGVVWFSELASWLGIEGRGLEGAALATGLSRLVSVFLGLAILRFWAGTSLVGSLRLKLSRWIDITRIGAPVAFAIAIYSGAYWALLGTVLTRLENAVTGGLGIGFQVFEGIAFPCYLGISIAGASLVGRAIGARDARAAWEYTHAARSLGRVVGVLFALGFYFLHPWLVPLFTQDDDVARETGRYVMVLAFSQYWVAVETVNEKVLLGSGVTRSILWISPLGNLLRVPLGWLFAISLGFGAWGLWWAINLTTFLKAFLFWRKVQEGSWLEQALGGDSDQAEAPDAASSS